MAPVFRYCFFLGFAFLLTVPWPVSILASPQQSPEDVRARARTYLNLGVQAYKSGQVEKAIEDFRQAKELDPSLTNARLYLATSYATLYIPGVPSEENARWGQQALEEFQGILETDPKNVSAIDGVASMLYNLGGTPFDREKMEEAKSFHEKHIQIRASDPEPYYWIGVIDWSIAFRSNRNLRNEWIKKTSRPLEVVEPLPDEVRQEFTDKFSDSVNEGIRHLKEAIELRADYSDAMAYLNLHYRMKAEMEPTPELREQDLLMANALVDQVKAIQKRKMGYESQPTN